MLSEKKSHAAICHGKWEADDYIPFLRFITVDVHDFTDKYEYHDKQNTENNSRRIITMVIIIKVGGK